MSFTASQEAAIAARGNVLVVAGAGTGKTRTLVERCLNCLTAEKPPASLDQILMVTFTEVAAGEMRQRIRVRLEEESAKCPEEAKSREQLALFDMAHIGTLHSFCLNLVREHFYELELDPQLAVLAQEEARLLAEEQLDDLLEKYYGGHGETAEAVQRLMQAQGGGSDQAVRGLILRLHDYTQTRPDPAGWMRQQLAVFAAAEPEAWLAWLKRGLREWSETWLPVAVEANAAGNNLAGKCAAALEVLKQSLPAADSPGPRLAAWRACAASALERICAFEKDCASGKKALWLKPLEKLVEEAEFLFPLARTGGEDSRNGWPPALQSDDPLEQDWNCVRGQMTALLGLVNEFTSAFTEAKRELAVVDFHDLEQYALRLLWDNETQQPTEIARHWRQKLRFVFVDEYQDINAAQDKIIEALSREDAQANRFLVGDVKQSIYRFRLANPYIFQGYIEQWGRGQGKAIPLVDNFRSREGLLNFVNSLFGLIMRKEVGGVSYDETARLRFGAPTERRELGRTAASIPPVELHLRLKRRGEAPDSDEEASDELVEVRDLEETDKEARLVALRLLELKARQHPVWDEEEQHFRPVQWRDMAVLLRAPTHKAESYAKEFSRLKVPLQVARGGFYESLEISDLLNLLRLLNNPLQDLPVLAVLHSPLVGLMLNELAAIRLVLPKAHFWTSLVRWEEIHGPKSSVRNPTWRKVSTFLERFARWRRLARQVSLSRCLETVLSETHYGAWLLTQPRGGQRQANVQRLVSLAQRFDQFQRQGLFRFLRFIEAQQLAETEPEVAAVNDEDAVRLMSIHQSKGLEFPVVMVADLGKAFNLADLRAELILDEEYGLCPHIKPPHTSRSYPSLPYWLARRRQTRDLLGEELRLLYVAMTRARDLLLLSGAVPETTFNKLWRSPVAGGFQPASEAASPLPKTAVEPDKLLAARSYADWLALWFAGNVDHCEDTKCEGQNALLRWFVHDDAKLVGSDGDTLVEATDSCMTAEPAEWHRLQQRLAWQYSFAAATREPAKTSVSMLRHRAAEGEEAAEAFRRQVPTPSSAGRSPKLKVQNQKSVDHGLRTADSNPVEIGDAHHLFLQLVSLDQTVSLAALKREAARLEHAGALSQEQVTLLDFAGLAAFWQSDLGKKVRAHAPRVQRELAFTARFKAADLSQFTGEPSEASLDGEFVVVQGVADLVVLLPEQLWLVDFKTDWVTPGGLAERASLYQPQLNLYAQALSQIYRRPVTQCWLYFLMAQEPVKVAPELLEDLPDQLPLRL
ncbi:MAG TPA: UvrD-helicase domain-containing protein [Candidatus Binatia bacterium]|jgi:ATP-dependent helicase/nuclease subunit A|nr:UvrD-helicase domain-containing protein [Candidatus Binatia bacterium]